MAEENFQFFDTREVPKFETTVEKTINLGECLVLSCPKCQCTFQYQFDNSETEALEFYEPSKNQD